MAIASYERTLVSDRSPFDLGTMTPQQELGFEIFFERSFGNCNTCHPQGNRLFSNAATRTIFLPDHDRRVKVPSLRNVGLRPRFMSSGQFTTMQEVLEHYQSIGFLDPLDPDQTAALIDFLTNALTDPRVAGREPPFDRPILRSERAPHGSNLFGRPRGGSGGFQPEILADVPANLGNPDFRIGLGRGLGGAPAVLALALRRGKLGSAPRNSIFVDLSTALFRSFVLSGTQPGEGVATFRAALPVDPALLGLERYAQWFVLDPGASGGIAASQAARFELFRR
jgi:hypothetical protein